MIFRKSYSESELISGLQAGGIQRERSTDLLIKHHRNLISRGKKRYGLSDQVAEETYLDAIMSLCQQVELGKFRGESRLSTYLHRIFENKCKNRLRDDKEARYSWVDDMPDMPAKARTVLEQLELAEELDHAKHLLAQLGGRCKEILLLSELQGYSQQEIADQLGLKSARVVATSRYRCLTKLKQAIVDNAILFKSKLYSKN